jgi:hypothetical protein
VEGWGAWGGGVRRGNGPEATGAQTSSLHIPHIWPCVTGDVLSRDGGWNSATIVYNTGTRNPTEVLTNTAPAACC